MLREPRCSATIASLSGAEMRGELVITSAGTAPVPNALRGSEIPLSSRIVQLCDAYEAITDPNTYQIPESHDAALAIFQRGGGAQFDAELAGKFIEMMNEASGLRPQASGGPGPPRSPEA